MRFIKERAGLDTWANLLAGKVVSHCGVCAAASLQGYPGFDLALIWNAVALDFVFSSKYIVFLASKFNSILTPSWKC